MLDSNSRGEEVASARALYVLVTSRLLERGDPAWFTSTFARARRLSRETFASAYASTSQRLGNASMVRLSDHEHETFRRAGIAPAPDGWRLDECARAALLLEVARSPVTPIALGQGDVATWTRELFTRGEPAEQQAVLRVLDYLPDPARLVDVATWGARSPHACVFESIACENSFPSRHFPDALFARMIERCIAMGVGVGRVMGASDRTVDVVGDRIHARVTRRARLQLSPD